MWAIDAILILLKDGEWHDLREIAEKSLLGEPKVESIVSFLTEFGFMRFDRESLRVQLTPLLLGFIEEIERIREAEAPRP